MQAAPKLVIEDLRIVYGLKNKMIIVNAFEMRSIDDLESKI